MTTINLFSCVYLSLFALYRLKKKKKKSLGEYMYWCIHSIYAEHLYTGEEGSAQLFSLVQHTSNLFPFVQVGMALRDF